jgi:hypothetical protein
MRPLEQVLRERAEAWHAPDCSVDAGGGCILGSDLKDAWIAGYRAASAAIEQSLHCTQHEWFSGGCPCDCHTLPAPSS